jgi:hypothetical protein
MIPVNVQTHLCRVVLDRERVLRRSDPSPPASTSIPNPFAKRCIRSRRSLRRTTLLRWIK